MRLSPVEPYFKGRHYQNSRLFLPTAKTQQSRKTTIIVEQANFKLAKFWYHLTLLGLFIHCEEWYTLELRVLSYWLYCPLIQKEKQGYAETLYRVEIIIFYSTRRTIFKGVCSCYESHCWRSCSDPTRIAFDSNRFELIRIDSTWIAFFEIFRIFSSTRIGKIKIHIHLNCDIFG